MLEVRNTMLASRGDHSPKEFNRELFDIKQRGRFASKGCQPYRRGLPHGLALSLCLLLLGVLRYYEGRVAFTD